MRPGALLSAVPMILLWTCTTVPVAPPPQTAIEDPQPTPTLIRTGLPPAVLPAGEPAPVPGPAAALDLDLWPFGWVDDPDEGLRLGHQPRFWSDQRLLWREALSPLTSGALASRRLETVFRNTTEKEERFRAAWHLWLIYRKAGLADRGRPWLDTAYALDPVGLLGLERLWDQVFRLGDLGGARALWPSEGFSSLTAEDGRKATLLRQKLFLGRQSFSASGGDDFVATLALDRDDLWAGTWNGSVSRWSMVTGEVSTLLTPAQVSPVNRLLVTDWFVYAFQDQALMRYSKVTGSWRALPYPPGWTGLRVTGAVVEAEESLTVAYLGMGLWRWDRGTWTSLDAEGGGPFVTALAEDGKGAYLVGTKDRGLWRWDAGVWTPVNGTSGPRNISVLVREPETDRWAVGTWGEGTWVLGSSGLTPLSGGKEYVTGAAWTPEGPLWGTIDDGLVRGAGREREVLGPADGLPAGGVSALVVWQGRWIWGSTGQGIGWWSEHENPALLR